MKFEFIILLKQAVALYGFPCQTHFVLVQTADKSVLFLKLIFNADCPHCHLQVSGSDLLCSDITALYQPVCMGYWGNDVGVSMCAGEQLYNMKYDEWQNVQRSSRYPNACAVESQR